MDEASPVASLEGRHEQVSRPPSAAARAWPAETRPRIELLGAFVLTEGERHVNLPANAQRVLAYLALRRRVVTRIGVASILWLDIPEDRARANLRTALWRIRHSFDVVQAHGSSIALRPEVSVDAHHLVERVHQIMDTDETCWARGDIDQFTSELLPSWGDDWLFFERERLRQLRLHALERVSVHLSAAGRHGEAVEAALAAVDADPLRDSSQRALVAAYLAEGNRGEALRAAETYRSALGDALGITPSAELEALLDFARQATTDRSA